MIKLVFSETHACEHAPDVLEILVFSGAEARAHFDKALATRKEETHMQNSSLRQYTDNNGLGALYKLRAFRNELNNWNVAIFCGVTGAQLYERLLNTLDSNDALRFAVNRLSHCIQISCSEQISRMRHE